jgi:3-(3-hydroxy-phenyl)propionate hydroxylase
LDVDPLEHVPDELRQWFSLIGGTASCVSGDGTIRDVDGTYRAWFESHGCRVVLSRPDFYIFGAGDSEDVVHLLEVLRTELHQDVTTHTDQLIKEEARS